MPEAASDIDVATTDLVEFIHGLNTRRLAVYQVEPADILEDHGIEENVLAGGYGYRQLLELVQNGVDAMIENAGPGNTAQTPGRIDMILDQSRLYAANTGAPLTAGGIRTLHSSNASTKRGNQVGRFGLGFKSLLRLNGKIDLFSKSVAFRFDPEKCRGELRKIRPGDAPGLRLSWVLEVAEQISADARLDSLWSWAATVVRAEVNAPEILKHLEEEMASFPAEFLLFLPMPVSVHLNNGKGLVRELHTTREADGIMVLHDGDQSTRWRVSQRDVRVVDESAKSDATHIHQRDSGPVAWALPLDGKREQSGRFWFCFPTGTQTRLPGILNAPWKLNSDRNAIIGGEWNKALMAGAAQLVVETLTSLKAEGDAARPLDFFPRQLDRLDEIAAPLVTSIWESLMQTPIIPDATTQAVLQKGSELWRHPVEKSDLAAAWADLASPTQRARMVHPSCYQNSDRISRLNELARRLKPQQETIDQHPNLRFRDVADWFADVRSAEVEIAMKVLRLAEAYSNACQNQQAWNADRVRLEIIPSENGELMRPEQLFLSPAGEGTPGLALVAFWLPQDIEGRRLVTEVMKVRALDDQRWLMLLRQALNSIGVPRTAEEPWRDLWNKLRAVPANIRERFLDENKGKVRVKRRDGQWVLPDEVLLPGRIVRYDDANEANLLMLVGREVHDRDDALLSSIGVSDAPQGDNGPGSHAIVLKDNQNQVSEWLHFWRQHCLQLHPNPADPGYLEPKVVTMPRGWPLLSRLKDRANVEFTQMLLEKVGADAISRTITFGHRTNQHYPPTTVSHPLLWLLCKHGRVAIGHDSVRVAALVWHRDDPAASLIPSWDRYQAAIGLLSNAKPQVSIATHDNRELWEALIHLRATPESLVDNQLAPLWAAAARCGVVPATLPWRDASVSLQQVYVTESPELSRRARSGGKLAVTLDAETLPRWIEHGAQRLDELLKADWTESTPPAPVPTVFPELSSILKSSAQTACQSVANLQLCFDGQGEPVACLFWKDTLLADRKQLSGMPRSEMLKRLITELAGAGWLNQEPQAAFRILWDEQVEDQRRRVRECATLPERLFEAVGRNRERLLEALGELRKKPFLEELTGVQLAEVVLALLGASTLSKLSKALEENGLKPPARWSSDDGRAFVEGIGFDPEYAASSAARRDAEEFISGPIKLPPLHDYQEEVYECLRVILSNGSGRRRGVVSLPTGGGKTRVVVQASVELILHPEEGNRTVLWIAQTDELCEQAVQAFRQVWINCGPLSTDLRICRLWGGNPNPRSPEPARPTAIVASIQTLSGRVGGPDLEWLTKTGMMVIDECHHAITKSYTNVLRWLGAEGSAQHAPEHEEPPIIGLSATPFRGMDEAETKWLANRFDNRLLPNDPGRLYVKLRQDRVLAHEEYEPLNLPTQLPRTLRQRLEALAQQIASEEMPEGIELLEEINQRLAEDEERNAKLLNAVAQRVQEHPQTSILFFCNSVLHAEEMAARLHLNGISAASISGETPPPARRDFLEKFKDGRIKVLCNHSVLTTGFDAPKTDTILIARQVFSRVRYMQMVGRGLRGPKNGGTERCKIVTVNDNLGRFDNARHWEYCRTLWNPDILP